jgi:TRAP-type transport system small permease protein
MDKADHKGHQDVHFGGHHEGHQEVAYSAFGKVARILDKIITPFSTYFAYIGAGVLGFLVLMLLVSIITRRVFVSPLAGAFEMTELGLVIITFSILSYHMLKHEVMTVDFIERYFPKRAKAILEVFIKFLTVCILGILCWQLIVQGIRLQGYHQTTRYLLIPIFPFLYLGALGVFTLAIVYIRYLLYSLDRMTKK